MIVLIIMGLCCKRDISMNFIYLKVIIQLHMPEIHSNYQKLLIRKENMLHCLNSCNSWKLLSLFPSTDFDHQDCTDDLIVVIKQRKLMRSLLHIISKRQRKGQFRCNGANSLPKRKDIILVHSSEL